MLTPSYSTLITALNKDADLDSKIPSRYSIVTAAAKRARQIVAGAETDVSGISSDKAVTVAVNELALGHVKIVPKEGAEAWDAIEPVIIQNFPTLIDDNFVMGLSDDELEGVEFKEFDSELDLELDADGASAHDDDDDYILKDDEKDDE
ncbi:MAG: DNA-directed RNA polymerase subunit omega [Defluviitaleaceae bacterium]|nr:DNA-directed RNA polymerase subunit omega [Defluviitaleaceae bacterium]